MKENVLEALENLYQEIETRGVLDKKTIAIVKTVFQMTTKGNDNDSFVHQLVSARKSGVSNDELNEIIALVSILNGKLPLELVMSAGKTQEFKCC